MFKTVFITQPEIDNGLTVAIGHCKQYNIILYVKYQIKIMIYLHLKTTKLLFSFALISR